MLRNYAHWGRDSPATNVLSSTELRNLRPQDLIARVRDLYNYERRIFYFGPLEKNELLSILERHHRVPETLRPVIPARQFEEYITSENRVLFVPFDNNQINFAMISKCGRTFDPNLAPYIRLYNSYFGRGVSSIVFQEMRETRGLAYSARVSFDAPTRLGRSYTLESFIATQNDKMDDAVQAFLDIINNMPESEIGFEVARYSILTNLRTQRTNRAAVLWRYIEARDLGLDYDLNKFVFERIQNMTLDDVVRFQREHVKNRKYTFCILGRERDLDFRAMASYGRIVRPSLRDIFGY